MDFMVILNEFQRIISKIPRVFEFKNDLMSFSSLKRIDSIIVVGRFPVFKRITLGGKPCMVTKFMKSVSFVKIFKLLALAKRQTIISSADSIPKFATCLIPTKADESLRTSLGDKLLSIKILVCSF